jgi:TPR repeat protein
MKLFIHNKRIKYNLLLLLFIVFSQQLRADAFEMGMASLKAGDFAEAYCLWRPLAMRGHVEAAFHLGWLYANGNGLRVDIPKAVYWWGQAAKRGHSDAMFALALAYTNGKGIKKDDKKAASWYVKAALKGHEDAREILKLKIRNQADEILPYLSDLLKQSWVGKEVVIGADGVNLRAGPGINHPSVGKGLQGEHYIAVQHADKWYQIIKQENLSYAWVADWLVEQTP